MSQNLPSSRPSQPEPSGFKRLMGRFGFGGPSKTDLRVGLETEQAHRQDALHRIARLETDIEKQREDQQDQISHLETNLEKQRNEQQDRQQALTGRIQQLESSNTSIKGQCEEFKKLNDTLTEHCEQLEHRVDTGAKVAQSILENTDQVDRHIAELRRQFQYQQKTLSSAESESELLRQRQSVLKTENLRLQEGRQKGMSGTIEGNAKASENGHAPAHAPQQTTSQSDNETDEQLVRLREENHRLTSQMERMQQDVLRMRRRLRALGN